MVLMLVVQQNHGKKYECIISVFEYGLGLDVIVICIQKLFLGNQDISHFRFNIC